MQAQQLAITMKTQVSDQILIKYGLKPIDVNRAVAHFKLDEDKDIISIKSANTGIRKSL